MKKSLMFVLIVLATMALTGCGDGGGNTGGNTAAAVNAGPDQNISTGSLVTLNGSGSTDANGDTLAYSWSFTSKPAGSAAALSSATVVNPTFTADKDGAYVLSLVVNDGTADSAADTVTVTAATGNSVPDANAGIDQNVATSSLVTLNGSGSTDANGDTLTYSWSFTSKPAGSAAALLSATVVNPTFTADKDGAYVLSLVVNDGTADSAADTITITAATANSAPVANAGIDQNVSTSSLVTLNGSGSTDANGDTLTYSWSFTSKPAGSAAALLSATVVNPTFTADKDGAYVLSLVVNDGTADSAADTITITAATANSAPVANAGVDQNVATGSLVTLNGSGSTDANGDTLTYSWSFTSKPAGSAATLSSATVVNPTFTADQDGAYVLSLVVNDGTADSAADTVTITAATANSAPVANAGIDQNVSTSSLVTLNGSGSTDADGNTLTYSWSFTSKPAGSAAALSSATVVNPTFTADQDGAYVLSLVVNDGTADSAADTVTITVATANSAPVANAGIDQNVSTSSLVTLNGSGSTDANGDTLTYSWSFTSKPAGSAAALSSATVVNPTFTADMDGAYVLSLIVNDGAVSSTADTVTITAATANSAPVANAGIDQNVATSSVVTLDGSGSTDANGDTLTYSWSFTSKPASSAAALSSATVVSPTFTGDKDGAYVLSLVVNDGAVSSTADTVTITAFGPGANFKMTDTNQTTSYTATFGEDHDYTINAPSYTDNGSTITDNITTLVWQKQDDAVVKIWAAAITYCDDLTLDGQTDWRLPSRTELISIIDNGVYSPAINTTYFPNTISSDYWSSTTYVNNTSSAWAVDFSVNSGYSSLYLVKTSTHYARCVRGGQ